MRARRKEQSPICCFSFYNCCLSLYFLIFFALTTTLLLTRNVGQTDTLLTTEFFLTQNQTLDLGADEMLNAGDVIVVTLKINATFDSNFESIENATIVADKVNYVCNANGINNEIPIIQFPLMYTCTGVYVITQMDITSMEDVVITSELLNQNGTSISVVNGTVNVTQTTFGSVSAVQMLDGLDLQLDDILNAGDTLNVTNKVMNDGTETLLNVTLNNNVFVAQELLPMEMTSVTYIYVITQNDIDNGGMIMLENSTICGTGTTSRVEYCQVFNGAQYNLLENRALDFEIEITSLSAPQDALIGSVAMFSIQVTNVGDTPSLETSVSNTLSGVSNVVCGPMMMDNTIGVLFPQEVQSCSGAWVLTEADFTTPYGNHFNLSMTGTVNGRDAISRYSIVTSAPKTTPIDTITTLWATYEDRVNPSFEVSKQVTTTRSSFNMTFQKLSTDVTGYATTIRANTLASVYGSPYRDLVLFGHSVSLLATLSEAPTHRIILSNFIQDSKHVKGYIRIFEIVYIEIVFQTDPPDLQQTWNIEIENPSSSSYVWNPTTGVLANTAGFPQVEFLFDIGQFSQYNSITMTVSRQTRPNVGRDDITWHFGEEIMPQ